MVLAATSASTVSAIPVFLLGAMGFFIRSDIDFGQPQLGLAISAFWVAMAIGGIPGGRIGQGLGATASIRIGVLVSMAVLLGLVFATSWLAIVSLMVIAGFANALTQPAVDLALFQGVPKDKLSLAFGIKQTALPGAAFLAGIGVPLVANTVGWRWGFAVGALVGAPAILFMPRLSDFRQNSKVSESLGNVRLRGIFAFVLAFALAMIAVSATAAFYVESVIAGGNSAGLAGLFLAAGGIFGMLGRFIFAWRLGNSGQSLLSTSVIMSIGGLGLIGLVYVHSGWQLLLVTLVAIGAGWGWNGLLTLAVVTSYPKTPARASGYIVLGAASGGIIGPALFGVVVQSQGFAVSWTLASACFFFAALILLIKNQTRKEEPSPP